MSGEPLLPSALVTGASSGIGRAFAAALSAQGYRLVLVGRDARALAAVAEGLPGPAEILLADLATDDGVDSVLKLLSAQVPDVLVNAAGLSTAVTLPWSDPEDERRQLAVNVGAVLRLSQAAAIAMAGRRSGVIINVASTAAFWSVGTYAASKAWVVAASEGLSRAVADDGVRVLVVCPGFTRTDLHARAGVDAAGVPGWLWLTPDQVVDETLSALRSRRTRCIPGRRYRVLIGLTELLPRSWRPAVPRRLAPLRPVAVSPPVAAPTGES